MKFKRTADFHGLTVPVSEWANYLSADADGFVHQWQSRPRKDPTAWWRGESIGAVAFVCEIDLEGMDWRETLVEIEE